MLWHSASFALFDDAQTGAATLFDAPGDVIEAHEPEDVPRALAALDAARARGLHAAGFLAYELGFALEPRLAPLMPARRDTPLLSFGLFEMPRGLSQMERNAFLPGGAARLGAVTPLWNEADYSVRFQRARDYIAAGDVYQVNLTFPLRARVEGAPAALFKQLQTRAGARYGALLSLRDRAILSLSPELFLESDGAVLRARPMKGTAPRAARDADDEALKAAFRRDPKTRAENLMIVDLLRNDLGRVARTGAVRVASLFDIETYPTLHQMTSTVEARLAPDVSLEALFKALFPCGSVTGAPKIRAMEIIHALEGAPRGVCYGAIGHLAPQGRLKLNVSIRTMTIMGSQAHMHVGSGLVYDSDPAAEYVECLLKGRFLSGDAPRPALFETLLHEAGQGYWLLDEHVSRLTASARRLGYPCAHGEIMRALESAAGRAPPKARIRLTLSAQGALEAQIAPCPPAPDAPLRLMLSARRTASTDPLLYHKTTARAFYDGERARLAPLGCDEVIFTNERGELTEGSFTNLFIERDGALLTPALACGLLPGTLRRSLLDSGRAKEAVLYPHDLVNAPQIYAGNSLRGLMPARLVFGTPAAS